MDKIIATIYISSKLHKFLMNEVKWKEQKSASQIITEALEEYFDKRGYKLDNK